MAFVQGSGGGAGPGPGPGNGPGPSSGSADAFAALTGGLSLQQLQEALIQQQQQQQQQQMIQQILAMHQQQQQQQQQQQASSQHSLLAQLQQQLMLSQLSHQQQQHQHQHQQREPPQAHPAPHAPQPNPTALLLLLQQQQAQAQAQAAAANPLMAQLAVLQQHHQQQQAAAQQQSQQDALLQQQQQRMLVEAFLNQQAAAGRHTPAQSAVVSVPDSRPSYPPAGVARPQPVEPVRVSALPSSSSSVAPLAAPSTTTSSALPPSTSSASSTPSSSAAAVPTHQPPPMLRGNSGLDIARAAYAATLAARAANAQPANLTSDPKTLETHITRIISENEALLEPAPVLLKRRPYHRSALGPQSSIDNDSNHSGSSRTSPGPRNVAAPATRPPTTRSQSLFEMNLKPLINGGGSLTSGLPLNRSLQADIHFQNMFLNGEEPSTSWQKNDPSLNCSFCGLQFPNEPTRMAHEARCGKRETDEAAKAEQKKEETPEPTTSSTPDSRHPLKRRLLAAAANDDNASKQPKLDTKSDAKPNDEVIVIGDQKSPFRPSASSSSQSAQEHPLNRRATAPDIPVSRSDRAVMTPQQQADILRKIIASGGHIPQDQLLALMNAPVEPPPPHVHPIPHHVPRSHAAAATVVQPQITPVSHPSQSSSRDSEEIQILTPITTAPSSSQQVAAASAASTVAAASVGSSMNDLIQQQLLNQIYASGRTQLLKKEELERAFMIPGELAGLSMKPYYLTYPLCPPHKEQAEVNGVHVKDPIPNNEPASPPYAHLVTSSRDSSSVTPICTSVACSATEQKTADDSNFSNLYTPPDFHDENESKLNHLYMGTVSAKPRMGEKLYWRYSIANKEGAQQRMTHSSFWELSLKKRFAPPEEQEKTQAVLREMPHTTQVPGPSYNQITGAMQEEEMRALVEGKRRAMAANRQLEEETEQKRKAEAEPSISEPSNDIATLVNEDPSLMAKQQAKRDPVIGGYRTDEVYVYVRGRGRGRYVCERCGIRCKKPSMLKKHMKSHTDIRPYQCKQCNFFFKTKGNLTKHIASKAHKRKTNVRAPGFESMEVDSDDEDRLEIAVDDDVAKEVDIDIDHEGSDDDDDENPAGDYLPQESLDRHPYHKFGQEQILFERNAHTPPSRWMRIPEEESQRTWPEPASPRGYCRRALSAPPAAISAATPVGGRRENSEMRSESRLSVGGMVTLERGNAFHPYAYDQPSPSDILMAGSSAQLIAQHPSKGPFTTTSYPAYTGPPLNGLDSLAPPLSSLAAAGSLQQHHHHQQQQQPRPAVSPGVYVIEKEEFKCSECDKVCSKATELALHVQTHNFDRNKVKMFYCPECKMGHKTKLQLTKHIEVAHPRLRSSAIGISSAVQPTVTNVDSGASGGSHAAPGLEMVDPTSLTGNLLGAGNPQNNPRSFLCSDCNIGFRKHGILAKHLRSKTHVMKLETQKLLPEDALTLITKKDNASCLNEVDTTSCETARKSILKIVERIRAENGSHQVQVHALPSATNAHSSIPTTIEERLLAPIAQRNAEPNTSVAFLQAARSLPYETNDLLQNREAFLRSLMLQNARAMAEIAAAEAAISRPSMPPATSSTQVTAAAVWMPPRAEDLTRSPVPPPAPRVVIEDVERLGNGHSSTAVTPPALTRCGICDANFDNPMEHQVHLMTEHIVMRDGHDLACPRPNCEKVYPDRDSLRAHILAHFMHPQEDGGPSSLAGPRPSSPKHDSPATESEEDANDVEGGGEESSCQSPDSTGGLQIAEDDSPAPGGAEVRPGSRLDRIPTRLKCSMCELFFEDADSLQTHWLQHIGVFVCKMCDGRFTQKELLEQHINTSHPTRTF